MEKEINMEQVSSKGNKVLNKKYKASILLTAGFLVLSAVFFLAYRYSVIKMQGVDSEQVMSSLNRGDDIKVRRENEVYDDIHKMANTKVEADQVIGKLEITEEKVDSLIKEVSKSIYSDKEKLLEILGRWKNKDFSQCVEDHNYVWERLGGQIGKATKLREE